MSTSITRRYPFVLVGLVLVVLLLSGCERSEVDGIGSYTPDDQAPPQLDVVLDGCAVGEWGWATGNGMVQNRTGDVATYEVVVAFDDGDARIGQGSAWIRDLGAGSRAAFRASTHLGERAPTMSSCHVITVNRWSAETRTASP